MKTVLFLLPFLSFKLYSQNVISDSLLTKRKYLEGQVIKLKDSIKAIDSMIILKSSNIVAKYDNMKFILTTTREGAKLRRNPIPFSDIILTIEANKEVKVFDYYSNYLGVCVDTICGYLNDIWVNVNDSLKKFIQDKQEIYQIKMLYLEELEKIRKEKNEVAYEKKLIARYGKTIYDKLKHGMYWIGMTDEMALISLGYPDDINRSVGVWGVHEQWVYAKRRTYLYFENGKLGSYQE